MAHHTKAGIALSTPKPIAMGRRLVEGVAGVGNVLGGLAVITAVAFAAWSWAQGAPLFALGLLAAASMVLNVALGAALQRSRNPDPTPQPPILMPTDPPEELPKGATELVDRDPTRPAEPPVPVWFLTENDPSSITMTDRDLDSFADAADRTAKNLLGPDAATEFDTFQISVARGFMPSANLYFDSYSATAQKMATIQFSLWASTKPGIASIEKLESYPAADRIGPLRPWIADPSWKELLRLSWLAERPFSGQLYVRPRPYYIEDAGQWICRIEPSIEGVKHPGVTFTLIDGALTRL